MISVVFPTYNVEKYVINSLESIIQQTYADFELIIVDDGSVDNTVKICTEILTKTKINWKLLKQENHGQSTARNCGLKVCKGEYVVFVDSDDILSKNFLSALISAINILDCNMVFCDFTYDLRYLRSDNSLNYEVQNIEAKEMLDFFLYRKREIIIPAFLYRKNFLIDNNIYFRENVRFSEDQLFLWECFIKNVKPILFYKEKLYFYLKHPKSIMTSSVRDRIESGYIGLKMLIDELQFCNYKNMHFIEPRWIIGALYSAAKYLKYDDFIYLYKTMNAEHCFKRLASFGDMKAELTAFIAIFPHLFYGLFQKI
ncbi:glycosyltransferase family 2 protein [Holdemania massiliensis]|uniref:glycosyltransferase family 2 protein n=1 Tax=Holdemania massiliensis TaxID=1468449 RepID=UPI002675CCD0|nr:glycosyltransferase family 2 protein [Holdemania massiliensis]